MSVQIITTQTLIVDTTASAAALASAVNTQIGTLSVTLQVNGGIAFPNGGLAPLTIHPFTVYTVASTQHWACQIDYQTQITV